MEVAQTAEAHAPWQKDVAGKKIPARLAIIADGAHIPLVKGDRAEVRTVVIGEAKEQCAPDAEQESHQETSPLPYPLQRCLVPVVLLLLILGKEVQYASQKGLQNLRRTRTETETCKSFHAWGILLLLPETDPSKTVFPQ